MKILFFSTWFPYPADNGSKLRVYQLLRSLARTHQVTLASFSFGEAAPDPKHLVNTCCERVEIVHRNPFERARAARASRFASLTPVVNQPVPEMAALTTQLAQETRFDRVIASTTGTAAYALMVQQTPRVLEEHNSPGRWAHERCLQPARPTTRMRRWLSWQKTRRYEATLYRQFALCTMVSEADRAATLSVLKDAATRVETVPNGVDCTYNRPGIAPVTPGSLVFNGSLTYDANYDAMQVFLSSVWPQLRQEIPSISLTITGSVADVDLTGLALDSGVSLSGFVEDVRPLVAGAAVCVAPIRQGGGTRLKILEAMALGTPVVATSKAAEGLNVNAGEHLLIGDTETEFASCVLRLLRDDELRGRLARNARQLVEETYEWSQIGARFAVLVDDCA